MKRILLSNGEFTLVSNEDFIWASGFSWCTNDSGYVVTASSTRLHRLIAKRMGLDMSLEIDHINRVRLNNQRENLRNATSRQNSMNSSLRKDNTSGFRGVSWDKRRRMWKAKIKVESKHITIGRYFTKETAIFARKIAEQKYFKEFANV